MLVLGLLSLTFAFAALILLILWLFQTRDARALARLVRVIREAASAESRPERVDFASDHPDLSALTSAVNQLLDTQRPSARGHAALDLYAAVGDRVHEIVLVHRDTIVYANPQFAQRLGVAEDSVVGRRLADLVPPDQTELVAQSLARTLAGEDTNGRFEIDLIGMQGQLSRLEIANTSIDFDGGKALLITGVEVIPTQTVKALGGTGIFEIGGRSRARLALDSLGEALITTDVAGRIDYANAAAATLLGVESRMLKAAPSSRSSRWWMRPIASC